MLVIYRGYTMKHDKQVTLAITGASGAPYALTLLKSLVNADYQVYVLISSAAKVVFATEENVKIPGRPEDAAAFFTEHCNAKPDQIKVFGKEDTDLFRAGAAGVIGATIGGTLAGVAQKGVPNPLRLLKRKKSFENFKLSIGCS